MNEPYERISLAFLFYDLFFKNILNIRYNFPIIKLIHIILTLYCVTRKLIILIYTKYIQYIYNYCQMYVYIYIWKSYISEFILRYIIISWEVQQIIYDTFKKKQE